MKALELQVSINAKIVQQAYSFSFTSLKSSGDWLNNNVTILNITELYS